MRRVSVAESLVRDEAACGRGTHLPHGDHPCSRICNGDPRNL